MMPRVLAGYGKKLALPKNHPVISGIDHEMLGPDQRAALSTVFRGDDPVVDIVAVHGLNGDGFGTFTSKTSKKFWLGDQDMLPCDIENCRVLTYSYPSSPFNVFGPSSSETILQLATTFAQELAADRQFEKATRRPIIFLCHSLGGLITKRALYHAESRQGRNSAHLRALYTSTYGILFFGTPHNGSSRANLASFASRMIHSLAPSKIVDSDSQLLEALKEGSEVLQEVTDNFQPKLRNFCVFFFWEQLKTDLGSKYDFIVPEYSAAPILDETDRAGLRANHSDMCKFVSRDSPGYKLVVSTLMRYLEDAPDVIARRWVHAEQMAKAVRENEARELLRK